jgi:hypothetical protein
MPQSFLVRRACFPVPCRDLMSQDSEAVVDGDFAMTEKELQPAESHAPRRDQHRRDPLAHDGGRAPDPIPALLGKGQATDLCTCCEACA